MSFSSLECYAMDKLQCGIADLSMLDDVYSTLGEDVYDCEDLVNECDDLNSLLERAYDEISEAVKNKLYEIADDEEFIEISIHHKDNEGDICDTEIFELELTEEIAEQIKEKADELTENYAYANCLDTHFQNDLDQVVDWDYGVEHNAIALIEYWVDSEDINISSVEPVNITAYVLSEDGSDREFEVEYVLRGKKVYKYGDECICDMSDDEEIDENYISERICEDQSPDFVKSIDLDGNTIFENPEEFDSEDEDDEG